MEIINKIVKMNKHFIMALIALALMSAFAISALNVGAAAKQNEFPNKKQFECFNKAKAKPETKVKEQGGVIKGTIKVPKDCRLNVTLVVYKVKNGNWQDKNQNQVIFDKKTHNFGPGVHTFSVKKPNCAWQADMVYGKTAVQHPNPKKQKPVFDAAVGNKGIKCVKPAPKPTKPVKPINVTNTVVNTVTNENVNEVNVEPATSETTTVEREVVTETEQPKVEGKGGPTTLPETGPGEVIGLFSIISVAGAAAYQVVMRRLGLDF